MFDVRQPADLDAGTRCTSTGRKCDGYEFTSDKPPESGALVLSTSRTNTAVATTARPPTPQLPTSLSRAFEGDEEERRIFHRFKVYTIPAFAGGSEATFWSGLVLRVGEQEPVVRNAIIALGTLHEDYQARGGVYSKAQIKEPNHQNALRLYGKALRQLNERLDRGNRTSAKLAIIVSVLFTCFEVLRRNNMAAVIHYQAGMREMVRQINMNEGQAITSETSAEHGTPIVQEMPQTELDDILRVFARYDIQACTFVKARAEPVNVNVPVVPPESFTLGEVKRHLDNLLISVYQLVKSDLGMYRYWPVHAVPQEWVYQRDEAVQTFENWMAALEQYFRTTTVQLSPSELKSLLGLRMQIKVAVIQLKTCIDCGPESSFDAFYPEFQDIVARVDRLTSTLQLREGPPLNNEATPFTMELGIIHPLFFVATKCRHYRVRRRAINLLKRSGREGIFEGPIMAIIALRMAQMEEEGVLPGSIVPERNRFHDIRKNVDYEKSMVLLEATKSLDDTSWRKWETVRMAIPF
jgi:Fungal specific transcription factor domain